MVPSALTGTDAGPATGPDTAPGGAAAAGSSDVPRPSAPAPTARETAARSTTAAPVRSTPPAPAAVGSRPGVYGPPVPPAPVLPGVRINKHIPTVEELREEYAEKGLVLVDAGAREETDFRVATFNMLGSSHTRGPSGRKGFGSGPSRAGRAVGELRSQGVSVVGLQELQRDQAAVVERSYALFPGTSRSAADGENSIAWDTSVWELVQSETSSIPYFGGRTRQMPHVLLEHLQTGQRVWFGNYHNPADTHGGAQRWRDAAVAREAALAEQLTADGTPMIITGDMNDREQYGCSMSAQSGMHASDGTHQSGSGCVVSERPFIDWIMGSSAIEFTDHVRDDSTASRKISDHPMIHTSASVPARTEDPDCTSVRNRGEQLWFCPPRAGEDAE